MTAQEHSAAYAGSRLSAEAEAGLSGELSWTKTRCGRRSLETGGDLGTEGGLEKDGALGKEGDLER